MRTDFWKSKTRTIDIKDNQFLLIYISRRNYCCCCCCYNHFTVL